MVTFRFYVVSVVAFFLALAVGVVLGSALDGRISNSLKDRLERVESNLDSTVDLIDQKNDRISALNKYAEASIPFAVQNRLADTGTILVAQSGLSNDAVADMVAALRQSGTSTAGVIWLDKSWNPESAEFMERVNTALGRNIRPTANASVEDQIWSAVLGALGARSADETAETTTTTTVAIEPDGTTPAGEQAQPESDPALLPVAQWWEQPLIKQLAENSVLRLQPLGQTPGSAPITALGVVALMGPDSELNNDNSEVGSLARMAVEHSLPVVIGEMNPATGEPRAKDSTLKTLIESDQLTKVSSVQAADEVVGRVATVVALQRAANGQYGNYGQGSLASSLLPSPPTTDGGS